MARRSTEVCTTSGSRPASVSSSPPRDRLGAALVGEVDVDPAGEQVLGVPVALAVAEQDQGVVPSWRQALPRSGSAVGRLVEQVPERLEVAVDSPRETRQAHSFRIEAEEARAPAAR